MDDMPQVKISFYLSGDDFDLDDVTEIMEITPSETRRKGDFPICGLARRWRRHRRGFKDFLGGRHVSQRKLPDLPSNQELSLGPTSRSLGDDLAQDGGILHLIVSCEQEHL